jgi:hypothetical protein
MTSLGDLITRTNHFIETVKAAEAHKYTAKAKKAKGASKSSSLMIEPIHETFEIALAAAFLCSKCVATKFGTKGCRACMGEHFEQIRLRKARNA